MSVHEEIREQQKKLKGQGFKAYWDYFWDYYKIHTIVAIAVIIFIVILVRDITDNKPYSLYALMLNSSAAEAQDYIESSFAEYSGIDTTQTTVMVDTTSSYNMEIIDEMTIATSEKIMANISASELDVLSADKNMFAYYSYQDVYLDLREVFDEDFLSKHSDILFYVDRGLIDYIASDEYQDFLMNGTYDETNEYAVMAADIYATGEYPDIPVEDMKNPVPVGFYITASSVLEETGAYYGNEAVAGIIVNTQRLDAAKLFIEYLLQ